MNPFSYCRCKFPGVSVFFLITLFMVSCENNSEFNMGENFVESETTLKVIDTFKVDLSTVILDSIETSNTEVALVGRYTDNQFGTIFSSSYFKVGFPAIGQVTSDAIFDSAVVVLDYSNYSYGDTTKEMSVSIHTLNEEIDKKGNTYLYNSNSFSYSTLPVGTKVFYPRPNDTDTLIYIRVDDYGLELFNLYRTNSDIIKVSEYFLDYVKGFVIVCDYGNSILGFDALANNLFMKIYYHYEREDPEEYNILIPMNDASSQFNSIQHDFTGSPLEKFSETKKQLKSSETGNVAFLQVLAGLMPKIQFPTLKDLFLDDKWKIIKAELVIEPVRNSYDLFALPEILYLFDTNKHNVIGDILVDVSGNVIVPAFKEDLVYNEETSYTFDITTFINNELADSYVDYNHGILIGLQGSSNYTVFDRIIIEDNHPTVKLRLYYLSY